MSNNLFNDWFPSNSGNQINAESGGGDGYQSMSNWGTALQGFGNILGGWGGIQQARLGRQQLRHTQNMDRANMGISSAAALAQAQARKSSYAAAGMRQDYSYLDGLIETLRGYQQQYAPQQSQGQIAQSVNANGASPVPPVSGAGPALAFNNPVWNNVPGPTQNTPTQMPVASGQDIPTQQPSPIPRPTGRVTPDSLRFGRA